jgi:Fe-S-cluster-containing hydrogenase component 2
MGKQAVWVDVARCVGCGACLEVCPAGAVALVNGRAYVDEEVCTGCRVCVDVCPEGAIQSVIRGEIIPSAERPVPVGWRPHPLVETAGPAIVASGAGMLVKVAGALGRAVGRWLTQPSTRMDVPAANIPSAARYRGAAGRGRRACHRRRGC